MSVSQPRTPALARPAVKSGRARAPGFDDWRTAGYAVNVASEQPPRAEGDDDREVSRLERLWPELMRRILEAGLEKLAEGPENVRHMLGELKGNREELLRRFSGTGNEKPSDPSDLGPTTDRKGSKDVLNVLLNQVDETKNGVYRAVAKEVRDFLGHTNLAEEMARVLTSLSFEIKTEVRFIPNDKRSAAPRPDISSSVRVKHGRSSHPPPATPETSHPHPEEEP